jgi:WD40 repeat protein/GTPase SAR1 family protein
MLSAGMLPRRGEVTADDPLYERGLRFVHSMDGLYLPHRVAWSPDGSSIAVTDSMLGQSRLTLWSRADRGWERRIPPPEIRSNLLLCWAPTEPRMATWSPLGQVFVWSVDTDRVVLLIDPGQQVSDMAWSPDGRQLATLGPTRLSLWDVESGRRLIERRVRTEDPAGPTAVRWSARGDRLLTAIGSEIGLLDAGILLPRQEQLRVDAEIGDMDIAPDGRIGWGGRGGVAGLLAPGGEGQHAVLEGHVGSVTSVAFSPDGAFFATGSTDGTVRLWRCRDLECVSVLRRGEFSGRGGIAFHPREPLLAAKQTGVRATIDLYRIDYQLLRGAGRRADSSRYVNAKVVLVGDTGVGKSGLGLALSGQPYRPTDSTHGRHVWPFEGSTPTRELLIWDLAGQPGYRLIHQLHLNEVSVALIVFDARSETDPFSGVRHWARALAQARRLEDADAVPCRVYLVAARCDRGGVAASQRRIDATVRELGLDGYFETSAREGWQIARLSRAIRDSIAWDALPTVSSNHLFQSIKRFLLAEKAEGRVLTTADDLFRAYCVANVGDGRREHDDELQASFATCIGRVEARGLIHRLRFGGYVLLQPQLLDSYASALVQAARDEPDGLGLIAERDALSGSFRLPDSERIGDRERERLLLIATVEELLRHEVALKEVTERGVELVFPAQFTRERPDAPNVPGVRVTFRFEGPLMNIYATLAVRLAHSQLFERREMWRNAASFTAATGGTCGIVLRELEEGRGDLAVFFDEDTDTTVRQQFEAYVREHLSRRSLPSSLSWRRAHSCPACDCVLPEEVVRLRLDRGATTIRCPVCDERDISLVDVADASPGAEDTVAAMERSADIRRDRDVAATRLKGKIATADFDVFLTYNSQDRAEVLAIDERLRERGLLPWLDVREIPPGADWQRVLAQGIRSIRSAAVFIGPKGTGPWQDLEVEQLLNRFVKSRRALIPVILGGRRGTPRLPAFLDLRHAVDMRVAHPDPLDQLVWGITGERPPG